MDRATKLLLVAFLVAACAPAREGPRAASAEGPEQVQVEVAHRHAEQFDEELPARRAGSQQEEAAAAYVLGHLQRAGYVTRLEAVPVADTVNSTDVIAVPPRGDDPAAVVAVPLDTGPNPSGGGTSIGIFLELARALAAARPRHDVGFAALGAEHAPVDGGYLGTRRLARTLLDDGSHPLVLTLESLRRRGGGFGAVGSDGTSLVRRARDLHVAVISAASALEQGGAGLRGRAAVLRTARLDHVGVTGGTADVGRVLLSFLVDRTDAASGGE
ncbi:MAG TPA: hypothetical protein VE712_01320 [Actinomycetota bacterium]|nr:hypothetical protein [Actinomycetota bacterium]